MRIENPDRQNTFAMQQQIDPRSVNLNVESLIPEKRDIRDKEW